MANLPTEAAPSADGTGSLSGTPEPTVGRACSTTTDGSRGTGRVRLPRLKKNVAAITIAASATVITTDERNVVFIVRIFKRIIGLLLQPPRFLLADERPVHTEACPLQNFRENEVTAKERNAEQVGRDF